MRKLFYALFFSILLLTSCQKNQTSQQTKETPSQTVSLKINDADILHQSVKALSAVIIEDIFVPPVSSRIYAYATLAAYEALRNEYPDYQSITAQLNGFEPMPAPEPSKQYAFVIASIRAFFTVGKGLIHSPQELEKYENQLYNQLKPQIASEEVFKNSIEFGNAVAEVFKKRITKDNYKETRGMERYTPLKGEQYWQPTAPAYMDAVEPFWNKILPFSLEKTDQFKPEQPYPFSLDKKSPFYKETIEVYEVGKNLTQEQKIIATFWDNNPFEMKYEGHLEYAVKKISPGGHWIQITSLVAQATQANLMQTAESYALVAVALADGFISCWDEKYRSNYVRPQTVIEKHIDDKWTPYIQTPPFPEYTSGHSVISHSAATVLTKLYGENFAFTDSTQTEYGLPPRSFKSFLEASGEASMSRLYGGIHFRKALEKGGEQGIKVGTWVMEKVKTKKTALAKKD
ncbi:vanadium-dependent haloperoxidase [Thermoflexibacter ruber]|uniref:PAP2 superfamily protein n=1 Tax=Thermoflexibacter ruber TaxID=1003 RepID=A0A1I2JCZ3_9BACT|nr:vanadium-dependent haloperoxidase [Thermoflexibacter ruber]SFF51713.1 PAP2 superfamily protein [Thermoflexibacter ruber]